MRTRQDEAGSPRPLQGRGRKSTAGGWIPPCLHFRPAYIYPVEPRKEPNFGYRLLRAIYPMFRVLFPSQVIGSDDLARVMVDVVVRKTAERGGLVTENPTSKRWSKRFTGNEDFLACSGNAA